MKSKAGQEEQPLTMAQELERMLGAQDEDNAGMTVRQALCKAVIQQAKGGNFKALEWIYKVSGEQRRDLNRRPLFG